MALFDFVVSICTLQYLPSRWTSFLVGTICGVGIPLIAGLHGNLRVAKTLTVERNDMPTPTVSLCTDTPKETTKSLSGVTREERTTKGDRGSAKPQKEETSPLVQREFPTLAEPGVQAPSVQLDDLVDLEDYLYQPNPEAADETRLEKNENESIPPKHTCWCITASGSSLEPLLQEIYQYFSMLENKYVPSCSLDFDWQVAIQQDICDFLENAALYYAIVRGHTEIVSRCIARQRSVDWNCLKLAIGFDQIGSVEVLLASKKLSKNLRRRGLEEAAYQGRLKVMDLFMVDATVNVNGCGETNPLKAAAAAGQIDAMRKLIRAGADLEARGKKSMIAWKDYTPLIAAVAHNRFEVVEVLLCAGVRIKDERAPENTPLDVATTAGNTRIIALLLQHGAKPHALRSACVWADILGLAVKDGLLELANRALSEGANINMAVAKFGTLLKRAVIKEDEQMVTLLINHGAVVNYFGSIYEFGGNCALLASASCRNMNIFLLLLHHGALIKNANGTFGNLMQTMAHLGYSDIVQAVLEKKPDIDVNDTGDSRILFSPLYLAMYGRRYGRSSERADHMKVARLLSDHGAKLIFAEATSVPDLALVYPEDSAIERN